MISELVIYIHGVSNDLDGRSHDSEYRALHDGIRSLLPGFPARYLGVEWGWNFDRAATPAGHRLLTAAQSTFGRRALETVGASGDFTLNPARLVVSPFRPLTMYGFADMFYYVSTDGKNAVRQAVANQIVGHLKGDLKQDLSLTLIGHSAGSVIAFDLAFYLYYRRSQDRVNGGRSARSRRGSGRGSKSKAPRSGAADEHTFIEPQETPSPATARRTITDLRRLRRKAADGTLRIRRLITMGSPISLMAYRSNALLKILAKPSGRVDAAFHGLMQASTRFPTLQGPRWINIWDKDDPIAWPVEPLMSDAGSVVVDEYVDVSDSPRKAHDAYWRSAKVHAQIARRW